MHCKLVTRPYAPTSAAGSGVNGMVGGLFAMTQMNL